MNANLVVTVVVAIVAAFGATGIAALLLVPKQRQQIDASSTFQLTQSIVLANQELDRLRERIATLSADFDNERALRRAAEDRLDQWQRRFPPPAALPGGGPVT